MSDKIGYISETDWEEMSPLDQWQYVQSIMKYARDVLEPRAEQNCEDCEANMLSAGDINIDFEFEDWRDCAEDCDNCNKEKQVALCNTQFEIINHLANEISNIHENHRHLVRIVFKKDEQLNKIYVKAQEARQDLDRRAAQADDLVS